MTLVRADLAIPHIGVVPCKRCKKAPQSIPAATVKDRVPWKRPGKILHQNQTACRCWVQRVLCHQAPDVSFQEGATLFPRHRV